MRVLVVDDSGVMRKMIIRTLQSLGFDEIDEASDGNEGIQKFYQTPFDLVLTDWNMPGKNGLDMVKEIRGAGFQTPIIMITTVELQGQVQDAFDAGVNDYLNKPFEAGDLMEKIDALGIHA